MYHKSIRAFCSGLNWFCFWCICCTITKLSIGILSPCPYCSVFLYRCTKITVFRSGNLSNIGKSLYCAYICCRRIRPLPNSPLTLYPKLETVPSSFRIYVYPVLPMLFTCQSSLPLLPPPATCTAFEISVPTLTGFETIDDFTPNAPYKLFPQPYTSLLSVTQGWFRICFYRCVRFLPLHLFVQLLFRYPVSFVCAPFRTCTGAE